MKSAGVCRRDGRAIIMPSLSLYLSCSLSGVFYFHISHIPKKKKKMVMINSLNISGVEADSGGATFILGLRYSVCVR